jgi:hypothetical protein
MVDLMDTSIILEAVYERDIDLLLLEEMHVSTPFRRWLEVTIIGEQLEEASFIDAYHSILRRNVGWSRRIGPRAPLFGCEQSEMSDPH